MKSPIMTDPLLPPPRREAITTMRPPIAARRIVVFAVFLNMVFSYVMVVVTWTENDER
jgi:hypothetical protein